MFHVEQFGGLASVRVHSKRLSEGDGRGAWNSSSGCGGGWRTEAQRRCFVVVILWMDVAFCMENVGSCTVYLGRLRGVGGELRDGRARGSG